MATRKNSALDAHSTLLFVPIKSRAGFEDEEEGEEACARQPQLFEMDAQARLHILAVQATSCQFGAAAGVLPALWQEPVCFT